MDTKTYQEDSQQSGEYELNLNEIISRESAEQPNTIRLENPMRKSKIQASNESERVQEAQQFGQYLRKMVKQKHQHKNSWQSTEKGGLNSFNSRSSDNQVSVKSPQLKKQVTHQPKSSSSILGFFKKKISSIREEDEITTLRNLLEKQLIDQKCLQSIPTDPYKKFAQQTLFYYLDKLHLLRKNQSFHALVTKTSDSIKQLVLLLQSKCQSTPRGNNECWCIVLLVIFRKLNHHNSYNRRLLKRIFTKFNKKIKNPIQLFGFIEYIEFKRSRLAKNLPYEHKQSKEQMKIYLQQKMSQIRAREEQIQRRHSRDKQVQIQIPRSNLVKVSQNTRRRKVVTVLISGYLSQDQIKEKQWKQLIQIMGNNEVYCLDWAGNTMGNLAKFSISSLGKIIGSVIRQGPLGKMKEAMEKQIQKTLAGNPFNATYAVADQTGRFLGELLIEIFPDQYINLVGYSLAAQIILESMKTFYIKAKQFQLNKVVLIGGVADHLEFQQLLSNYRNPIELINCYTENDMVLKYLLKAAKPTAKPVGLFQLDPKNYIGHQIFNLDCSEFISGHLAYQLQFELIGTLLKMHDQ